MYTINIILIADEKKIETAIERVVLQKFEKENDLNIIYANMQ